MYKHLDIENAVDDDDDDADDDDEKKDTWAEGCPANRPRRPPREGRRDKGDSWKQRFKKMFDISREVETRKTFTSIFKGVI